MAAVIVLAALCGLLSDFLSGATITAGGLGLLGMAGAATAPFLITTLGAALAVSPRNGWTRIAVRVAGNWVAALGVLALGWTLKS